MATWTVDAEAYADRLTELAEDTVRKDDLLQQIDAFRTHELLGRTAAGRRRWSPAQRREAAWLTLHGLEEETARHLTDVATVREDAVDHVERELPKAEATDWKERIRGATAHADGGRAESVAALHTAHDASTSRLRAAHAWRSGTLAVCGLLGLLACAAVVAQVWLDPLVALPGTTVPAWALLAAVMGAGLVGAAVSALLSVYAFSRRAPRDVRWFDPRPTQAVAKLALGAWTAVLLVWLVGAGLVVGGFTSLTSVVLLAVIGGFAQETVTNLLDKVASGFTVRAADTTTP